MTKPIDIDGILKDAERVYNRSGYCLKGEIFGDKRLRHKDGKIIVTSNVIHQDGNLFFTKNSAYLIENWRGR